MNINFYDFSNTTKIQGTVPHITFNNLNGVDFIKHGFSTRLGGVSKGIYSSMNLSFTRGDDEKAVSQNFEIIGNELDMDVNSMVYAMQTHTTNVMKVTKEHCGMGVTRERNFQMLTDL